jgi:hypothetical protein
MAGCSRDAWQRSPGPDDAVALVPWFATMHKGLAPEPYEHSLAPVPGTVPITGVERELHVDNDEHLPLLNRMRNPVPRTAESLDRGKEVFGIYCYPCHGPTGQGDGPVAEKFIKPPSLTEKQARDYSDGYLFAIIRYGRGLMPVYGDKVRGADRWHLVNYLRSLQAAQ